MDAWKVDETGAVKKSVLEIYRVEIEEHPADSSRIIISNFYNVGDNARAEAVLTGTTLNLPGQVLPGGFTVEGSGNILNDWNTISWSYSVDDGSGVPVSVTAIYTRLE